MNFYKANVADVLRLNQRDELFIMDSEQKIFEVLKLMGSGNYHRFNTSVSHLARIWYYFMTSMGNLQTLGEEYTGTIRCNNNQIPSKGALLRQWMKDDTFVGSFYILGNLSLFYVLLNFVLKLFSSNGNDELESVAEIDVSKRGCILCGENIKSACSTPCGHIFCWNCIYEGLQYQKNCPVCREEIKPSRIVFLQNFV